MRKLNSYQKNLREIIENEIRKNTKHKYYFELSYKDKHIEAYKRFYTKYGASLLEKREENEKTIEYITRINMLEEYYQVILESKGHFKINIFLEEKNKLKKLKVAKEKEENERKKNLLKENDNKKINILKQNLNSFFKILEEKYKEIHNIPKDENLILKADYQNPIYKDINNAFDEFFHSYNRNSMPFLLDFYMKIYLENKVLSSHNFFELQENNRKGIIINELENLSEKTIDFEELL